MTGLPVMLLLGGRRCLVVGSGGEAALRVRNLRAVGAVVTVIADEPGAELLSAVSECGATLERRGAGATDIRDHWLVILADVDARLRAELGAECARRQRLFCAVDQPDGSSSFHHVAVTRHGPVTLSISTDGRAPLLARRLREELDRVLTAADLGQFAIALAAIRDDLAPGQRRPVLARLLAALKLAGTLELPVLPAAHSKSGTEPPDMPGGG
ncbi:MAG: hypothetical protein KF718_06725 [Polyangiaceae bacterium]|nr:hypothetical protein [Polyangiaceae bacterium]